MLPQAFFRTQTARYNLKARTEGIRQAENTDGFPEKFGRMQQAEAFSLAQQSKEHTDAFAVDQPGFRQIDRHFAGAGGEFADPA